MTEPTYYTDKQGNIYEKNYDGEVEQFLDEEQLCALLNLKDLRIAKLEQRLKRVADFALAYEKNPVDIWDRPESWAALQGLLDAAREEGAPKS
jgi:hypothetical protein